MTGAPSPDAELHVSSYIPCPQSFHRTFACGHPEEFILVHTLNNGEKVHNIVSSEIFKEFSRTRDRPTYVEAQCLNCAREAKGKDDNDPGVRPKRTLSAYRSGTSSTYRRPMNKEPQNAFESTLEKHRRSNDHVKMTKPHARVSEEDHRAHRHEILKVAVEYSEKWLALPVRRVTGIPDRTTGVFVAEECLTDVSHALDSEYKALLHSKFDAKNMCALGDGSQCSSGYQLDSKKKEAKHTGDVIFLEGITHILKQVDSGLVEDTPKSEEESLYPAAQRTPSLLGSGLGQHCKLSDGSVSNADSGEAFCPSDMEEMYQIEEGSPQPGRDSVYTEHLVEQAFEYSMLPPKKQAKYENPRPTPVVPRRSPFSFRRRRSNTASKASTNSESESKHFRASYDIFHSARSFRKRDSVSRSPDWACRTSLAIEAGIISMDSVDRQNRKSISSIYSPEARANLSNIISAECCREETVNSGVRHGAQSPVLNDYSPTSSLLDRYSERALQTMQRASTISQHKGMDTRSRKKRSRHPQVQTISSPDLDKNLPALPS